MVAKKPWILKKHGSESLSEKFFGKFEKKKATTYFTCKLIKFGFIQKICHGEKRNYH